MWASDQNWSRRGFKRIISNEAGEEIGEWQKTGFFHNNPELRKYEDEASFFEEERKLKSEKRSERVRVGFDKDRRVSYIQREVHNFDPEASNFREIETQELDYTYGEDGQIQKIVLTDYEPPDITGKRKVRSEKTVFEDREAQQLELLRKYGSSQTEDSSSAQQPVIKKEKPSIFKRLFRR